MQPPSWPKDERQADMVPLARLLYRDLHGIADREGRLPDRPRWIKAEIFPYDACDVVPLLDQLAGAGLIVRYVGDDGQRCIWLPEFADTQRPHMREAKSVLPAPPEGRTNLGNAEHLPRQASAQPRTPVSESESVVESESVSVPVSKSGSVNKTEPRSGAKKAGKDDVLVNLVPKAIEAAGPDASLDTQVDALLWLARPKTYKRADALRALGQLA